MLQYPVRFQAWGRPGWDRRQKQGSGGALSARKPQRSGARGILDQWVRVTEGKEGLAGGLVRQRGRCRRVNMGARGPTEHSRRTSQTQQGAASSESLSRKNRAHRTGCAL